MVGFPVSARNKRARYSPHRAPRLDQTCIAEQPEVSAGELQRRKSAERAEITTPLAKSNALNQEASSYFIS
jgi:hypothetical protein